LVVDNSKPVISTTIDWKRNHYAPEGEAFPARQARHDVSCQIQERKSQLSTHLRMWKWRNWNSYYWYNTSKSML